MRRLSTFAFLCLFLFSSFNVRAADDDKETYDLAYWQVRIPAQIREGRSHVSLLLEMLVHAAEEKDPQGRIYGILRDHGPFLFYDQKNERGQYEKYYAHFRQLILITLESPDLISLKKYFSEKENGDVVVAKIFLVLFYLSPAEKSYIYSLRKKLETIHEWGWSAGAKEIIESLIKGYNQDLEGMKPSKDSVPSTTGKDGKKMMLVEEGEFMLGSPETEGDKEATKDENPQEKIYVSAFYMDETEVTHREYAAFLNENQKQGGEGGAGRSDIFKVVQLGFHILYENGRYLAKPGFEDYPVIEISWEGARDYCLFYEKALPTEFQWEKAAKGPTHRKYPWGDEWDSSKLNSSVNRGKDKFEGVAPVGQFPEGASPFGILDLAGNVREWTSTWYSDTYYAQIPDQDPQGPGEGKLRVVRGGSWQCDEKGVERCTGKCAENKNRTSYRGYNRPFHKGVNLGFRCVKNL